MANTPLQQTPKYGAAELNRYRFLQQPCKYQPSQLSPMFENNHNEPNFARIEAHVVPWGSQKHIDH